MIERSLSALADRMLAKVEVAAHDLERDAQKLALLVPTVSCEAAEDLRRIYALACATHIQGIYSKVENVLKQVIEQIDGPILKTDSWHMDLLELAATTVPDVRGALISEDSCRGLKELLRFRHVVRSNYAGELIPARVHELVPSAIATARSTVADLRSVLAS